ncbi:hypothetical protein OM076_02990 [Solirubrobacter ginsenosidimutans]|uniref:Uncharacterized protein n=1 Tax=Solirubrobacter ginsenosidimutans TaxID=490573 RepID=A0A9X3MMZ6_9ACTN|nr:hypothetical protein [Solirubrobacter ginsenosidimutans]MDA0159219.1 hypothetical protein [Solirubrobacter ginsenosidimutans]
MPTKLPWAAALTAVLLLTPAASAAAATLGQSSLPSPIRAYRDQAVWSAAPAGSTTSTLMLSQPGGVTALDIHRHRAPVQATVSRGPSGKPAIVAVGGRELFLLDPATGARTLVATGHVAARSPVLWGDRLAWIEGRDRIYTATIGNKGVRKVAAPGGGGALLYELGLLGNQLAISLNDGGTEGDAQVWLQELDGSRRHLVRKVSSGEGDRSYVGLSFDGGALYFAQVCSGDPSGCPGHGIAYRYRSGRVSTASVPLDLGGFAQANGASYWVTQNYGACLDEQGEDAPCSVERTRLRFR